MSRAPNGKTQSNRLMNWRARHEALGQSDARRCVRADSENAPPSNSIPAPRPPSAEGRAPRQSKRIVLPGWTAYAPAQPQLGRTATEDDTRIRARDRKSTR